MHSFVDFVRRTRPPARRRFHPPASPFNKALVRSLTRTTTSTKFLAALGLMIISVIISAFMVGGTSSWNKKSQYTVLIVFGDAKSVSRPLALLSINGEGKTAITLRLPSSFMVETTHGYGQYKSESLTGLAELEKLPYSLVTQSLAMHVGVDIRDVIWVNNVPMGSNEAKTSKDQQKTTLESLRGILFQTLFFRARSTMAYGDRYAVWKFLGMLRKDEVTDLDMISSSMVQHAGERYTLDPIRSDPVIFQLFSDRALRKENLAVAVVNAAQEPRLGTAVARAFANMGANVTSVSTANDVQETTKLIYAQKQHAPKKSATTDLLLRTLGIPARSATLNEQQTLEYRADIVVVIGRDAARALRGE